ncbi:response regulator [uncultured Roseobacter sp.]|uniref:response regulator n=1 Tax=uncultured Roseobacter sp. TaxID=114847 RepID=UPI0026020F65|nr:response regulator [uncultured Roseobacter sp.]
MSNDIPVRDFADEIAGHLPGLRRYARALTGGQEAGDDLAAGTLEAIVADPGCIDRDAPVRAALFGVFHRIWLDRGAQAGQTPDSDLSAAAQNHLSQLTTNSREALLMSVLAGFTEAEIAGIMQVPAGEVAGLLEAAYKEMQASVAGSVLIIEDEALIAMDLESMVTGMGHEVTGIARTHLAAVALAGQKTPDLILADIHLADNSSGIDAVADILGDIGDRPVIFITAYPERLLTGKRHEPAFMIAKPYTEEQVTVAVSQAMFFASTATLRGS